MKATHTFNLTQSLIDAVREVVAIEAKGNAPSKPTDAMKKKEPMVMIARGKGGGVKMVPKNKYDPKKHHLADEKEASAKTKMDPVGKADADVDNDGDKDKSDKYIHARRKAITKAIAKKKAVKLSGKSEFVDVKPKMNESEELDEVITKDTPAGEIIKDFVHSKNPKFAGKSKKERIRMALGAFYAKQKE